MRDDKFRKGSAMRRAITAVIAIVLVAHPARAAEPALNDLPAILQQLRGCQETHGIFGNGTACRLGADDVWVAVHSDGEMTIFYGRTSEAATGRGYTVGNALRDLAATMNKRRDADKAMLDALAPFLPTQ